MPQVPAAPQMSPVDSVMAKYASVGQQISPERAQQLVMGSQQNQQAWSAQLAANPAMAQAIQQQQNPNLPTSIQPQWEQYAGAGVPTGWGQQQLGLGTQPGAGPGIVGTTGGPGTSMDQMQPRQPTSLMDAIVNPPNQPTGSGLGTQPNAGPGMVGTTGGSGTQQSPFGGDAFMGLGPDPNSNWFVQGHNLPVQQTLDQMKSGNPIIDLYSGMASYSGQTPQNFWGDFQSYLPQGQAPTLKGFY